MSPHLPNALWALIALGVAGSFGVLVARSDGLARRLAVATVSGLMALALLVAVAARRSPRHELTDASGWLGVDALSLLLIVLTALLGWALVLGAPRAWSRPTALGRLVLNVTLVISAFVVRDARVFALLWVATLIPTWYELRRAGAASAASVYAVYGSLSALSFVAGLLLIGVPLSGHADVWRVELWAAHGQAARLAGVLALAVAIFIRKAAIPFHSWMAMVFAAAPPGPVLLLIAPMVGAYAFIRFVVPLLESVLGQSGAWLALIALVTAAYAAGLAFVQSELRRIVAWIAISQSALVLVGLECPAGAGLSGGVMVWLSAAAGMTGLGISAWMLEARFGTLDVTRPHGLYRRCKALALVFLLSGLSLVGLPGTIGFAGNDLLLGAVLHSFPIASLLLFLAVALNGFTLVRSYMRLFHGPPARGAELSLLPREWVALLVPLSIVIALGLYPAPLVELGADAAHRLLARSSGRH